MSENMKNREVEKIKKRRIRISSKRQITIPSKYYDEMGLNGEIDCIFANNMLILTPVEKGNDSFAEEILEDLIAQGYSGQKLLKEFKRVKKRVRPAVEKLITAADELAREASSGYIDKTDEIFNDDEEE